MTLAQIYRDSRPPDYTNFNEWARFVMGIDREAKVKASGGTVTVTFTDGSTHTLDRIQ